MIEEAPKKEEEEEEEDKMILKIKSLVDDLTLHIEFKGETEQVLMTCDLKLNMDQEHLVNFFLREMKGNTKLVMHLECFMEDGEKSEIKLPVNKPVEMTKGKAMGGTIQGKVECEIKRG